VRFLTVAPPPPSEKGSTQPMRKSSRGRAVAALLAIGGLALGLGIAGGNSARAATPSTQPALSQDACIYAVSANNINLYKTPGGDRNGVVLTEDSVVISAPDTLQPPPTGGDWLFVIVVNGPVGEINDVGFINGDYLTGGVCHGPTGPVGNATESTEGCAYRVTANNINLYDSPDGNRTGAVLESGDSVYSAPRTFNGDQDWAYVMQYGNHDPVGWINHQYIKSTACHRPDSN
jgi:hypothetical protein